MWKRNDSTIHAVIAGDLKMDPKNIDNRDQEEIEDTTSMSGDDSSENDDSFQGDADSKYQGKPLEDQVRDLNATLKKVNQENKAHKKQIKDLQKENDELKQTAVNLKDQISNSKTEKEFAKKIQDLQEKLQDQEEKHRVEVDSLKKDFAQNRYTTQIKEELIKAGAKQEVMEYLVYEANKHYKIDEEDGEYIPVVENEQKSTRKLDPRTKDWVDNDFSDLASMMRDNPKYSEFFKAKTVVGIPSGSKVQRGSNNKAEKKIELARKIQKSRLTDQDRISLRAQAKAEGFDYDELTRLAV